MVDYTISAAQEQFLKQTETFRPSLPWLSAGPLPPRQSKKGRRSKTNTVTQASTTDSVTSSSNSTNPTSYSVHASPTTAGPRSWSDLLKTPGDRSTGKVNPQSQTKRNFTSLNDLIKEFSPETYTDSKLLQPRGLVNRGNMCYMNAILQVLLFCPPFYHLFQRIGSEVRQDVVSKTPLLDAMVMFIREFQAAEPSTQNGHLDEQTSLNEAEVGDPFIPDHIYKSMKAYPQFNTMQRGQQEDAEEFLGFLLDGLHEELVRIAQDPRDTHKSNVINGSQDEKDEWLEVGKNQKLAVTRTSSTTESPISRIFGGQLRSVLRIGSAKDSVTLEPFQPLQLDIQDVNVKSVLDALCAIPNPELISEEWINSHGLKVRATKQVYIETLPPVLILHLKRFLYDNIGGTQKSWKQIGYPLELDIPVSSLSPTSRGKVATKYRLTGVVYHHGLSAAGGHYTVDVLRQDRKSWLHFDDTSIERVPADKVAIEPEGLDSATTNRSNKLAYIILYARV